MTVWRFTLAVVFAASGVILSACAGSVGAAERTGNPPAGVDAGPGRAAGVDVPDSGFVSVEGILVSKCGACHGSARSERGLRVDSWDRLMAGSEFGESVIPFSPEHSLLFEISSMRSGGAHPGELHADTLSAGELGVLERWIAAGAPSPEGEVAFAESRDLVYVANQGEASVSIIDTDANVVARRVDLTTLGFSRTAKPHHIAVEPDGAFWYVSLIGDNRVVKFDRENRVAGQVELEVPGLMVLDSANDRLYVGRSMSAVNPPKSIAVIRTTDMSAEQIDVYIPRPHALAVSPSGDYVFAASLAENTIAVIDADTYETDLVRLGGDTQVLVQFAVAPDRPLLVAGGQLTGDVLFFDIGRLPALTELGTLTVGRGAWHPSFGLDGRFLYVPNKTANTVSVIDANALETRKVISGAGLAEPHGSALSHDGRHVYVSSNNLNGEYAPRYNLGANKSAGTVVVIDTHTNEIVKVLEVGSDPTGMGARHVP